MQIQLDDLDSVALARVAHLDRHRDRTVDRRVRRPRPRHPTTRTASSPGRARRRTPGWGRCSTRRCGGRAAARGRSTAASPAIARHAHRQPPARVDAPAQHAGDRVRCPLRRRRTSARSRRPTRGAEPSAYGRPASSVTTVGRAAREHGIHELLLGARQRQRSAASQPSPLVPRPKSPARSPSASTTTSARDAAATAAAKPSVSPPSIVVPGSKTISAPGNSAASASRSVGSAMPIGDFRMLRHRRASGTSSSRAPRTGRSPFGPMTRDPSRARRAAASRRCASEHDGLFGEPRGRGRGSAGGSRSTVPRTSSPDREVHRGEGRRAPATSRGRASRAAPSAAAPGAAPDRRARRRRRRPRRRARRSARRTSSRSAARRRCRRSGRRAAASVQSALTPCSSLRNAIAK